MNRRHQKQPDKTKRRPAARIGLGLVTLLELDSTIDDDDDDEWICIARHK